ncbi:hypothetical protein FPANT_2392 [Fusarium pseudoanthophilum]|uniref:Uncharacterized protein n=1 Tax=Fusarium pseudoanthophilum TaxID=48495 RepID=A0A8H5UV35_9HYPO|nr:hypothetical protein FPANT_2392 [Fusarium pseudoanthophilum]
MANSPPLTTSAPGSNEQEIISISTPGDSTYRLSPKKVFNPASIRMEDGYNENYLEPTIAAIKEIPDLIYKELEIMFFEDAAANIRMCSDLKIGWRADIPMCSDLKIGWRRADHCMTVINTPRVSELIVGPYHLDDWSNKEVMVYFEHESADILDSQRIARYIFREWLRLHNGRPFFQRGGFFGKPLLLTENGPQNLEQLSASHADLSEYVSTHVEHLVEFKRGRNWRSSYPGEQPPKDETPGDIRSWQEHGYHMSHLFRALYLVVDEQSLIVKSAPYYNAKRLKGWDRIHDMDRPVERQLAKCTILLVKTGDDAHLSSPISFLPLFEAGLASNVNRDDYAGGPGDEETAVRVSLDVAVRFVWDVLQREKEAFNELAKRDQVLEQEQNNRFQDWLKDVVSHSEEVGMDHNLYMWFACRRALARVNNEGFDQSQVYPVSRKFFTVLLFSLKHLFVISASALSFNSSLRLRRGLFPFPTLQAFFVCASTLAMASLDHIANVFSDYKYDEKVGFEGVNGIPCLGCVSNIDLDVRCVCVAQSYKRSDICVLCHHKSKACGSIPSELLGAAQWYWNFIACRSRRDPKLGDGREVALTGRELWQIRRALDDCGPAWRKLEMHLMNSNNLEILAVQESIANREILTLSLLQSAGLITNEELQRRIAAAEPPYARASGCVRTLRKKLGVLAGSAWIPVPSGEDGKYNSLPRNFPQSIVDSFVILRPCPAPRYSVVHSGGMSVLDGQM